MNTITEQTLTCPITKEKFKNPYIGSDNITYEYDAIVEWLTRNQISPITKRPMTIADLRPNYTVKQFLSISVDPPIIINTNNSIYTPKLSMCDDVLVIENPKENTTYKPKDILLLIDISGSMSENVTIGNSENHGFSILDIVKHAAHVVIEMTNENDRICVMTFESDVSTIFEFTKMERSCKDMANRAINNMKPTGGTNINCAIMKSLEMVKDRQDVSNDAFIILFTDGRPSPSPPRGEVVEFTNYKMQNPQNCPTLHTFGFGYNLDYKLLDNLSKVGNGMYNFIPDAGMVGTIFINAISNIFATYAYNVLVDVEYFDKTTITHNVGFLQLGQNREIVIENKHNIANIRLTYNQNSNEYKYESMHIMNCNTNCDYTHARYKFDKLMEKCLESANCQDYDTCKTNILETIKELKQYTTTNPIVDDLSDQVSQAFTEKYYRKWGGAYILSLKRAHQLQVCNNFKDPGVQVYGGELFKKLQSRGDTIFNSIKPPTPSNVLIPRNGFRSYSQAAVVTRSLDTMQSYNSNSNPCFNGNCIAVVNDKYNGSNYIMLKFLKKGMMVLTENGTYAKIVCIVKTKCKNGMCEMVNFTSGLSVTPYHPIKMYDKWDFPCNFGINSNIQCPYVYCFLLESEHDMIINGVTCITLGHNRHDGVLNHYFYGTDLVIESLKKLNGWGDGLVNLRGGDCIKVDQDNKIVEFYQ